MSCCMSRIINHTKTDNLGGPYTGFSAQQTVGNYNSSEQSITRKVLRDSWNTAYAKGTYKGKEPALGPYRLVNNLGDFLNRKDYSCGGSNQVNPSKPGMRSIIGSVPQQCDGTMIPPSSTNVKFVSDASDYIKFKKQVAMNRNYNDLSKGGDDHNGSYVPFMRVR